MSRAGKTITTKELQPVEENRPAYNCNLLDFMDILWQRLWVFFALWLRFNCRVDGWRGGPKRTTQQLKEGTMNNNVDRKKCCLIKSDSVLGFGCRHSLWFSGGLIWWRWFIFSITAQLPDIFLLLQWNYNWLKCRHPVLSSKGDMPKGLLLLVIVVVCRQNKHQSSGELNNGDLIGQLEIRWTSSVIHLIGFSFNTFLPLPNLNEIVPILDRSLGHP